MSNKKILIFVISVVIAGLIIGFGLNVFSEKDKIDQESGKPRPPREETNKIETTSKVITSTPAPQPTFPPLVSKVKSISSQNIVVTGNSGDMNLPKDPKRVRVYKRSGTQLILATFDDITIGQNITVKIITPGKLADLIIEP